MRRKTNNKNKDKWWAEDKIKRIGCKEYTRRKRKIKF